MLMMSCDCGEDHTRHLLDRSIIRRDPTGTMDLRSRFRREGERRLVMMRRLVKEALIDRDILGAGSITVGSVTLAVRASGLAHGDGSKVRAFQAWFDEALHQAVLGGDGTWMAPHIAASYRRARGRAVNIVGMEVQEGDKATVLAQIATVELQGINEALSQQAVRIYANGILTEARPVAIMRDISDRIKKVALVRLRAMVNVAIVQAYSEGTLDVFEGARVDSVRLIPEAVQVKRVTIDTFDAKKKVKKRTRKAKASTKKRGLPPKGKELYEVLTAADNKVCPVCMDIAEHIYTIIEARGLIPAHPNCRCAFVPHWDKRFAHEIETGDSFDPNQERDPDGKWTSPQRRIHRLLPPLLEEHEREVIQTVTAAMIAFRKKMKAMQLGEDFHDALALDRFDPNQKRAPSGSEKGGEWVREGYAAAPADRKDWPPHIRALVVPPAWKKIQYNLDPNGALLVSGLDAKGRGVYIYSPKFMASQAAKKFSRIREMSKKFDGMVSQVNKDRRSDETGNADVAALIFAMGLRPGSDTDTQARRQAYGATTLEGRHVVKMANGVSLQFVGKSGKDLNLRVPDSDIAKMLLERAGKAGRKGKLFPDVSDSSLREYVATLDGGGFKTKDIRTAIGTRLGESFINSMNVPTNATEYKKAARLVGEQVSKVLGNTTAIALQSYIDPTLFARWRRAARV